MAMMMARPTAASAAAWVMMKMPNICPASSWSETMKRENATNSTVTPLSMSSMLSRMPMALRRDNTPYMPSENRMLPRTRKCRRPGTRNSISVFPRDHDGADQRHGQQQRGNFEGQHIARQHQPADGLGSRNIDHGVTHVPRRGDDNR